jgi:hypothetical protein
MGPALHETRMGQRLIEVTLPRIADELANLNRVLGALVAVLSERLPPTAAPVAPGAESTERR